MLRGTLRRARITSARFRSWIRSGTDSERTFVNATATHDKPARRLLIGWYCLALLWCVFSTGCCRVLGLAYRTTIAEPRAYCVNSDKRESLELYSHWADEAWREQAEACAMAVEQPDYAAGFHDGFVDYVYAGGSGEPPPVPPRIFWNASLRTAEGKLRANQWFDGYREGARIAREAGYRDKAIVPSSIAGQSYGQPVCRQTSGDPVANPLPSPENVEELPEAAGPLQKSQTSDDLLANPFASPKNVEALPEAVAPLQKDASVDSKMPNPLPAELPLPANDPSEGQEPASDTSTVVPERVPATTTPAATEPKSAPEAPGQHLRPPRWSQNQQAHLSSQVRGTRLLAAGRHRSTTSQYRQN